MSVKVGEIGKTFRINASYNMSANTDLELIFTKPNGVDTLTVTSADGVTAPAVVASGTLDDGTPYSYNANEYWEFNTRSGDMDIAGDWTVVGRYIDATPREFCGDTAEFEVETCGG